MTLNKCKLFVLLPAFIFVFFVCGTVSAAVMSDPHSYLYFAMGDVSGIYLDSTSGGEGPEVAEVPFTVYFADQAPAGELRYIYVQFTFDPAKWQYVDATPTGWPGDIDPLQAHDPSNGVVALEFKNAYSVPIPTSETEYATFNFTALCQPNENISDLEFVRNGDVCWVGTDDGAGHSWSPTHWDDGSIQLADYNAAYALSDVEAQLGEQDVVVTMTGVFNFNLVGVHHFIEFDDTYLTFTGFDYNTDAFPDGCYPIYCNPSSNGNVIELQFIHNYDYLAGTFSHTPPTVDPVELFYFKFTVNDDLDNHTSCYVNFQAENCSTYVYGFCDSLRSIGEYEDGSINIEYAAEFGGRCTNAEALYADAEAVDFVMTMLNNFPAGHTPYDDNGYGDITVNIAPGDAFFSGNNFDFAVPSERQDSLLFDYVESGSPEDRISFYQLHGLNLTNFVGANEEPVDILNFTLDFDPSAVAFSWDNPYIELILTPEVTYTSYPGVYDTTGNIEVTPGDGLTLTNIPVEIVNRGQFYAPSASSNFNYVYQDVYLRCTGPVDDFSVQIHSPAYSCISRVICQPNVASERLDDDTRRIFSGTNFSYTPTDPDELIKIASVRVGLPDPCLGNKWYGFGTWFTDGSMTDDSDNPYFLTYAAGHVSAKCPSSGTGSCGGYIIDPEPLPNIDKVNPLIPTEFSLYPNRPNPFNPSTVISYDLPKATYVRIEVINILGQRVITLVDEQKIAGRYEVEWNGVDAGGNRVSSGIYLYRMKAGDFVSTKKMLLMK
jgi:hypothetical protein